MRSEDDAFAVNPGLREEQGIVDLTDEVAVDLPQQELHSFEIDPIKVVCKL